MTNSETNQLTIIQKKNKFLLELLVVCVIVSIIALITIAAKPIKINYNEILNNQINLHGTNGTYTKTSNQSGRNIIFKLKTESDYEYYYTNLGKKLLRPTWQEYLISVSVQIDNIKYVGIVCFNYGDFENSAKYFGEIHIDSSKICYYEFSGINCGYECPTIYEPTKITVLNTTKDWQNSDEDENNKAYLSDVWTCIRVAITTCNSTIHDWDERLTLW